MFESGRQYRQDELPSDIFNKGSGDIVEQGGQQYHVTNNGNGTRSFSPVSSSEQALNLAKQAQGMQIEANQPAIATLNTQKAGLDDQYQKILDDITVQYQPIKNATTVTTSNELGKRGITGDSTYGQQQIEGAQLPIEGQESGVRATTGQNKIADTNAITSAIASLQAGNVPSALNFGQGVVTSENQLAGYIANANASIEAAKIGNQKPFTVTSGQGVYTPSNNSFNSYNSFTPSPLGASVKTNNNPTLQSPGSNLPSLNSFVTPTSPAPVKQQVPLTLGSPTQYSSAALK